ncbi:MAG TPA: alpha-L-fucosidase [Candidatus Hydrogenedens sp.]|nr:alpha-L-fucosidase [Candidatus Hydrogenedens sp.]
MTRNMIFTILLLCIQIISYADTAPLLPTDETPEQREARLQWWREARFGMFIHWGPASVNGTEISWSRIGHPHDIPGMETVPPEIYDNLYKKFNPTQFNADEWMQLAKDAGMKYVVFITKHHDGFSMWHTKLRPDYSIAATPFHRDICKEIADAAHKYGLKLGWYYSTRDWTHPDYLVGDNKKYDEFYRGQIQELITNYGRVDILWFDHTAGNWGDYDFKSLFDMLYRLQPGIIVNNRAARFIRKPEDKPTPEIEALTRGDFDTPEQEIGKYQKDRPWESCITLTECSNGGGWSYRPDCRTRSAKECIQILVNCVCGDGNLLLNVGPMPTGEIAPEQVAVLKEIGAWLEKYGESIYGTRGGPFINGKWGGSTYKENYVYLHILEHKNNSLTLPSPKSNIVNVTSLTGEPVQVQQTQQNLQIDFKLSPNNPIDIIIKLQLDKPAQEE